MTEIHIAVLAGKPAAVAGVIGSAMAQQHLRNMPACLDMPTAAQPDAFMHAGAGLFDAKVQLGAASRTFLQRRLDHGLAWIKHRAT